MLLLLTTKVTKKNVVMNVDDILCSLKLKDKR